LLMVQLLLLVVVVMVQKQALQIGRRGYSSG
jgi:hypothetical protein